MATASFSRRRPASPLALPPQPTGRRLIRFAGDVPPEDATRILVEVAARPVATASAMGSLSAAIEVSSAADSIMLLERTRIAAVGGGYEKSARLAEALAGRDGVLDTRPEFWMFALDGPPWQDAAAATWGLDATGVLGSEFDGSGIRVAVLDTGIDLGHPDFAGRRIITQSFVPGETADDVQGHGTHCCGTAAGSRIGRGNIPRYGVAPGAELYMGKVLSNRGSGREQDIMAGIEWALDEGCAIISMSLGRSTSPDEPHDPWYEDLAQQALAEGALIVAAAGNDSDRRYGYIAPVGSPANAPSIMAVAAIGADAGIATFSCGEVGTAAVDIAAPGVGVFSSVPRPQLYRKLSGTSMACPHVAGIAALWAQSDPSLRGLRLWQALIGAAAPVGDLPARDVGVGLAKAP